jgi:hypothetical protein
MSGVRLNRVQRFLFPSIADLLFVGLLITRLGPTLFHDGDTGWHLWAGSATLERGPGAIPDALSFTRNGVPWENVEWLGEVLMVLMVRHADYMGVAVLCGLVFAASFSWLYRILVRETEDPPVALLVTALAAQVTLIQFLARPLIFSFPLFLAVVECLRKAEHRRRVLYLIPVLTAIWANVHPSAYLAPAMVTFFWIFRFRQRAFAVAALFSLVALGATPWGYSWVANMVLENRSYFGRVEEWASPQFGELRFLPYLLYLVLALAARRTAKPLSVGETVWGLGWMVGALFSARLGPYAAMAWAPWLARDLAASSWSRSGWILGRVWRGARDTLGPMELALRPRVWPVLAGVLGLLLAPALESTYPQVARGFPDDRFPRAALAEARRLELGPRVMNRYAWGGFISWESHAATQTFIDGRAGFFGEELLGDYLEVMTVSTDWLDVLDRHRPDWILVSPESPLVNVAPLTGTWKVGYRDSIAVILMPESGERDSEDPVSSSR